MPAVSVRPQLDLEFVRAAFPALTRTEAGRAVAYFDGPGGTQVPRQVVEAMTDYLLNHNANTHWAYPTSLETDAALAQAREALADFLGARPEEIAFGANMTTLTFHVARALARRWEPGDEIIITELDHHANVAPWQAVARERGLVLRTVPMDPGRGDLDWEALDTMLGPRVRLLAIGAASNALGTVNDVEHATRAAHAAGALCYVDAVHFAAHSRVDFGAIGCDFLACSAYKFYGPHVGVLAARTEVVADLDVPRLEPAPDTPPERLETGTLNHEGIVGAAAAVDFLASLGTGKNRREQLRDAATRLHGSGQRLVERMWNGLRGIRGVTVYGPPPDQPRTPTLGFTVSGIPSDQVARHLAGLGVYVSHGDFYAATVVQRLGLAEAGLVRAGCACYTTADEVDRLIEGVAALAAN